MRYLQKNVALMNRESDRDSVSERQDYDFDLFNPDDSDVASVMSCTTTATNKLGARVTEKLTTLTDAVKDLNSAVVRHLADGLSKMATILDSPGVDKKEMLKELNAQIKRVSKLAEQVAQIESDVSGIKSENEVVTDRAAALQGKLVFAIHYVHVFSAALEGGSLKDAKAIATEHTKALVAQQQVMDEEEFSDHILATFDAFVVNLKAAVTEKGDLSLGAAQSELSAGAYGSLTSANLRLHTEAHAEPDLKSTYNVMKTGVHADISQYVDRVWGALDDGLSTAMGSRLVSEGQSIFSTQHERWSRFHDEVKAKETLAEGYEKDALTLLSQHVDVEMTRCDKALGFLFERFTQSALQNVVKHVSGFVSCEADHRVLETVQEMLHKATQFLASRYGTGVSDALVPMNSLRNHLLCGDRLVTIPGLTKIGVAKNKAENLLVLLTGLESQATPEQDEEKSKIKHYRVIERIRTFFDEGMPRIKPVLVNPLGTSTPGKQASSAHAYSRKQTGDDA